MEKLPRQVYTSEFRQQAVELVAREGLGIAEASRRLSISPKSLTNRVRRARNGGSPGGAAAAPRREVTETEAELSRLRRENAELRMERDILKKAAASFASITYVATDEGWLYVAALKDLFAGEVVGRSFGRRLTTDRVVRALEQAAWARRAAEGLMHDSDRGWQYCSHEYQALLRGHGLKASTSRKGNGYENAPIESFWGTPKTELVHRRHYGTREEAARAVAE